MVGIVSENNSAVKEDLISGRITNILLAAI